MADATSVGTIELDIEVTEGSISREMGKLEQAFTGSGLTAGFKDALDGFTKNLNNFVKNDIAKLTDSIKESMDELSAIKSTPKFDTKPTENKFLDMFKRINIFARDSVNKTTSDLRSFGQVGAESNQKVSKSVQKLNNQYEKTQNKISEIRNEIAKLDAQRDAIAASYQDMPAFSGMTKEESIDDMVRSNEEYQRLGAKIAELEAKITPLSNKNRDLAASIKQVSDETSKASKETSKANIETSKMGSYAKKAIQSMLGLTWVKKLFSRESKNANNSTSAFNNSLQRMSRTVARNLIVYGLIIRGLRSMIGYMWSALKTNDQFSQSLNVIKTNLLVAFQPIYEFVLPALNALMQGIATVTTYIATAISALFGKTYQQSFNAAKGMNTAIKSMGGVGKATKGVGKAAKKTGKEVKGALAGFDEINKLDIPKDDGGSGGAPGAGGGGAGGFEMAMPDLATIDMSGIKKFKEIMSRIFEPFKLAWENEGQATIAAMKYALGEIKELIKAIGRSWLEVWTEGTGQRLIESILRVLQQIFYIIGDIAKATREAWEENERGTKFIREIHNMIINILDLIEQIAISWRNAWNDGTGRAIMANIIEIATNIVGVIGDIAKSFEIAWTTAGLGDSIMQHIQNIIYHILGLVNRLTGAFREVWGEVGDTLARVFLDTLRNILGVLDFLGEKLVWVWDHGGEHAFQGFVRLLAKIIEVAGVILNEFVLPFVKWFIGMIAPAIAVVLDWIGYLFDGISWLLDGFIGFLGGVKKFVHGVVEFFKWLYDVLVGNSIVPDMVKGIIGCFGNMFKKVIDTVKKLVNRVIEFFTDLKESAQKIWNSIADFMTQPINRARERVGVLVSSLKESVLNRWNQIRSGIYNMRSRIINAMMAPFKEADKKIKGVIRNAKDWGKNLIRNFIDGINAMIGKVRDAVKKVADIPKKFLGFASPTEEGPGKDADKWMPNFMSMLADGIEDNIHEVSAAVNMTAGTLEDMKNSTYAGNIANAVGSSVLQSMQGLSNQQSNNETGDVVIKIGESEFARIAISSINKAQRQAGKTLIEV